MNDSIAYQNKDIVSKVLAESLKGKSLDVYGLKLPKIVQVLPTNLPEISANELRLDNLFLLEDGSIAIIDYESELKPKNRNKYMNYISRILKRYENEGIYDVKIRLIVIYTGDIARRSVPTEYDVGAAKLTVEGAFLSELDSNEIRNRLSSKIKNGETLTDEEIMELIILPLTYRKKEEKQDSIRESVELAKCIKDEKVMTFVLSGIMVFTDKIIDDELRRKVKEWLMVTKIARMFIEENEAATKAAVEAAVKEKDAEISKMRADSVKMMAEKEAHIKELEAKLMENSAKVVADKDERIRELEARIKELEG